jgi:hypothetical protein
LIKLALYYPDTITDIGITERDTKIEEKERMVMEESICAVAVALQIEDVWHYLFQSMMLLRAS